MKVLNKIFPAILACAISGPVSAGTIISDAYRDPSPSAPINYSEIENAAMDLHAIQKSMGEPGALDKTIRVITHNPLKTVSIHVRDFMDSVIQLPSSEIIVKWSLGESENFQVGAFAPGVKNMLKIHATHPGADTTLTILGQNGRIYSFYIRSISVRGKRIEDMVTYIIDDAASIKRGAGRAPTAVSPEPATPVDLVEAVSNTPLEQFKKPAVPEYLMSKKGINPTDLNFDFEQYGGSKSLMPETIYSDGVWTYFQFSSEGETLTDMPVVYKVVDGYDHPVDSRVEKGTLIMKTVGMYWTIRKGDKHACIKAGG